MNAPKKELKIATEHARQGETYRLMAIGNQVKSPQKVFQDAIAEFDKAIGIYKEIDAAGSVHKFKKDIAWAHAHRGATFTQLGLCGDESKYETALKDFAAATKLSPKYSWSYAQEGETYRWLGITHFLVNSPDPRPYFEKAIAAFDKAIKFAGQYAWAYAHRGAAKRFLLPNPPVEESLQDFNKAIELNKNYAWAYAYRSVAYRLDKKFEAAYEDIEEAIRIYPAMFVAYQKDNELGLPINHPPYTFLTFTPSQVEQAGKILQQRTEDPYALYVIAVSKYQQEGLAAAKAEIEKARAVGAA